jgi:hypothetical protein
LRCFLHPLLRQSVIAAELFFRIMLCRLCRSIFPKTQKILFDDLRGGDHQPTLSKLEAAAKDSCLICSKTLQAIRSAGIELHGEAFEDRLHWGRFTRGVYEGPNDDSDPSPYAGQISVDIKHGMNRKLTSFHAMPVSIEEWAGYSDLASITRGLGEASTDQANDAVANLANRWLRNCSQNHKLCKLSVEQASGWYPERLLDLTGGGVRLLLTSEEKPKHQDYATLSYCWGPNPNFLHLTAGNLLMFRSGISFESLPKTFRNAVTLARRVGIFYLWIDALCIIQSGAGSVEDWDRQCNCMSLLESF